MDPAQPPPGQQPPPEQPPSQQPQYPPQPPYQSPSQGQYPAQYPPPQDPYHSMWQMSQVGQETGRKRFGNLRLGAGIIAGLVAFIPFGVVTAALWGWWSGESDLNGGGWAVVLIGLAAGFAAGGFVASESPDN